MMIKALILVHLWSLVVAASAWALQRDCKESTGANFPTPNIWLGLIMLSLLPGILILLPFDQSISFLKIETFEILNESISDKPSPHLSSLNYLTLYFSVSAWLIGCTLWRWYRLQCLPLIATIKPDVFTTTLPLPPLTLSWPRRAIVIPDGLQTQPALINHERAHLYYKDAEITLCLLILRDVMLRGVGVSYLIRQWRLSIELRADNAATKMLSTSDRRDYATLLLHGLKPVGDHADGRALPCPTAHLTSTRHRSVKMRLTKIMDNKPHKRKQRWPMALFITALGASGLGFISITPDAIAKDGTVNIQADEVVYTVRVPPRMPAKCLGLNVNEIEIERREVKIKDKVGQTHTAIVGVVVLKYDVRPDGSTHNLRVVKSNHPCFEPEAKTSLAQWMIEPQSENIRDVGVMLKFMLTGETDKDLRAALNDFVH